MFTLKPGDLLPIFERILTNPDDTPFPLTGYSVAFRFRPRGPSGVWQGGAAAIVSASGGHVSYTWAAGNTDVPGVYEAEWRCTHLATGKVVTFPTAGFDEFAVFNG